MSTAGTNGTHAHTAPLSLLPTVEAALPLLAPADVARQLAVSRSKVYQLLKSGQLRCVMIGRLPRVRPADLAAFLSAAEARPR